jgi:hypothetical protein
VISVLNKPVPDLRVIADPETRPAVDILKRKTDSKSNNSDAEHARTFVVPDRNHRLRLRIFVDFESDESTSFGIETFESDHRVEQINRQIQSASQRSAG